MGFLLSSGNRDGRSASPAAKATQKVVPEMPSGHVRDGESVQRGCARGEAAVDVIVVISVEVVPLPLVHVHISVSERGDSYAACPVLSPAKCPQNWFPGLIFWRPGRPDPLPKRWGAKAPTFLDGFPAARGRPDPQN